MSHLFLYVSKIAKFPLRNMYFIPQSFIFRERKIPWSSNMFFPTLRFYHLCTGPQVFLHILNEHWIKQWINQRDYVFVQGHTRAKPSIVNFARYNRTLLSPKDTPQSASLLRNWPFLQLSGLHSWLFRRLLAQEQQLYLTQLCKQVSHH